MLGRSLFKSDKISLALNKVQCYRISLFNARSVDCFYLQVHLSYIHCFDALSENCFKEEPFFRCSTNYFIKYQDLSYCAIR